MSAEGARPFSFDDPGGGEVSAGGSHERRAISTGPPRITPLREMQLVEAHRRGDPEALGELIEAYQRRVYSVCYRMLQNPEEAADLAQDALVKVLEGLDSYDGRSKLSTWVIRVALNCCLSHLRKQKLRKHVSLDGAVSRPAAEGTVERAIDARTVRLPRGHEAARELSAPDRIEQEERRVILREAMMYLDPDARAILILRDMQGLEYEQVAEALEIPLGTVKSRLFRARTALRATIEARSREK